MEFKLFVCMLIVTPYHVDGSKGACSLDAAMTWEENALMYLFKGDKYARWDDNANQLEYVAPLSDWKGIPNDLAAAVRWKGHSYFFKDCQYWRYTSDGQVTQGSTSAWKIPCNIDAAAHYAGITYFFKNMQYWAWGDNFIKSGHISDWELEGYFDAAVQWLVNSKTYFLKGKHYWRYGPEGVTYGNETAWKGLYDSELLPNCPCSCNSCCDENWEFESIDYKFKEGTVFPTPPEHVGHTTVDNDGTADQKSTFTVSKSVTETESFSHTAGATITVGTAIQVGIPLISQGEISGEISASYDYEYGKEKSVTKTVESTFECVGPPKKNTTCNAVLSYKDMNVPYTVNWKHKVKGCTCSSQGVFHQVASVEMRLEIDEIDKDDYDLRSEEL